MNKLYVVTIISVVIASFTFVNAEDSGTSNQIQGKASMMQQLLGQDENGGIFQATTGDANVDSQIKALNTEMERKIKAIQDDYLAKIKIIVGEKKLTVASTTVNKMMRITKQKIDDEKNIGRKIMGTSTYSVGKFLGSEDDFLPTPMMRIGNKKSVQSVGAHMMDFFRGMLGNN